MESDLVGMVNSEDTCEFIGQIIDTFEDFLEQKKIQIDNPEKEDSDACAAIIYGTDYGFLQQQLEDIMISWGILKSDRL